MPFCSHLHYHPSAKLNFTVLNHNVPPIILNTSLTRILSLACIPTCPKQIVASENDVRKPSIIGDGINDSRLVRWFTKTSIVQKCQISFLISICSYFVLKTLPFREERGNEAITLRSYLPLRLRISLLSSITLRLLLHRHLPGSAYTS